MKKFLKDVPEQFVFYLKDGRILKNLEELLKALKDMSKDVFSYHVNKEKNDFANWIRDIIKDAKLANELKKVKTKATTIRKLKSRIIVLKRKKR